MGVMSRVRLLAALSALLLLLTGCSDGGPDGSGADEPRAARTTGREASPEPARIEGRAVAQRGCTRGAAL